jgi:hypothetical protein
MADMDVTCYLPDEVGKWAKENDLGLSRLLRAAVEEEKQRREARAGISEHGFERVEVYDDQKERDVAFRGREIARDYDTGQAAYLTEGGAIVVTDQGMFSTFDAWDDLAGQDERDTRARPPEALMMQIADALGERYVEELDI